VTERHVALLRGVNVGGARLLKMSALEEIFRSAGAVAVESVIQSGNVVFEADEHGKIAETVERALEAQFGFRAAVLVRGRAGWRAMIDSNPFVAAGDPLDILHVAALKDAPDPARIAALDPKTFAPDAFSVSGADAYLRLPNGVGRATLTNARLDRALGTVSTLRNWRTVLRLMERLEA
jgi:uncharacterized protein (DUF1697 family)